MTPSSSYPLPGSEPILVSNLRSALAHLYSSSSSHASSGAHSYLIEFQSRNVRRKIQSLVQRQSDSQRNQQELCSQQEQSKRSIIANHSGSSMYASLSLLSPSSSSSSNHDTEQLFCAQTVLHRIRRMKLSEAIDFEMEYIDDPSTSGTTAATTATAGLSCANPIDLVDFISRCNHYQITEEDSFQYWKQFVSFHCERLSTLFRKQQQQNSYGNNNNCGVGLLMSHVLQHYYNQQWNNKNASDFYDTRWGFGNEMEERIKGEITLLVLSTLTYYNMYFHLLTKHQLQCGDGISAAHEATSPATKTTFGPLMNTLTSAMAVLALRLRYTPLSVKSNNSLFISANTTIHSLLDQNGQQQQQSSSSLPNKNDGATNHIPLVTMILQAIELVSQITSRLSMHQLLPTARNLIVHNSQQQLHQLHTLITNQTSHQCVYIQLSTLPDALLGGNASGGVRGKLSIDPRAIQYMACELSTPQTGISIVMETLSGIISEQQQQLQQLRHDVERQRLFLLTCERWARFVPLPNEFIEQSITYSLNHVLQDVEKTLTSGTGSPLSAPEMIQNAFCSYLISIFEAACFTVPQIIALHTGLSMDSSGIPGSQSGRKKQSSKSKKRHKEKLDSVTTNDHEEKAKEEHLQRGIVACQAALLSWEVLYQMYMQCLHVLSSSNRSIAAQGEGPIGCVCVMLSGCVPHIINHQNSEEKEVVAFTSSIMDALKSICSHDNPTVRALSFEHIPAIHTALVKKTASGPIELTELELCIAQKLVESVIALAEKCAYPHDYFNDLTMDNDEELEIERNDVRDILRSITNFDKAIRHVPLLTLDYILQYCNNEIVSSASDTNNGWRLPPETAVHLLSSPAKSLQCLAENIPQLGDCHYSKMIQSIIQRAMDCVRIACQQLIDAFRHKVSIHHIFPISRLMCICLASFSPFFSSLLANSHHLNDDQRQVLQQILGQFISVAVESITNLPELTTCSSLGDTVYDIRGAMRSPGGEDHVACIAIMRLVVESENLALAALTSAANLTGSDTTSILVQLSHLHDSLHALEMKRGPGVFHGHGLTPKSRRVLLKSICTFGFIVAKYEPGTKESIQSELYSLFHNPIKTILRANQESNVSHDELVHYICEATHDLSSFPPEFCSQLFLSATESLDSDILRSTQVIINTVVSGYRDYVRSEEPSEILIQWGRMRGAMLALLRSCANPGFSELAVRAITALNSAESDSIIAHSTLNDQPHNSAIFHSLVVSDEVIPAGAFLIVVRDVIENINTGAEHWSNDQIALTIASCTSALLGSHQSVFAALKSCCINIWEDPRPTIAEAWFFAMNSLIIAFKQYRLPDNEQFQHIVGQSIALCIHFIMSTKVDKEYPTTGRIDGFMSVDGPQSLAIVEFIELVLTIKGIETPVFTLTGILFQEQMNLDRDSLGRQFDVSLFGGALISATIFRGASGGLPPWAIENTPAMLKSMHEACGGMDDSFCIALQAGGDLRLCTDPGSRFLNVAPGKKPAGWFFDHMKPKAREDFLQKLRDICQKKDCNQWRSLKVLLKANCGGKKKATGFNLKPQPTGWECDRI